MTLPDRGRPGQAGPVPGPPPGRRATPRRLNVGSGSADRLTGTKNDTSRAIPWHCSLAAGRTTGAAVTGSLLSRKGTRRVLRKIAGAAPPIPSRRVPATVLRITTGPADSARRRLHAPARACRSAFAARAYGNHTRPCPASRSAACRARTRFLKLRTGTCGIPAELASAARCLTATSRSSE